MPEELVGAALQSLDALLEGHSLRYNRDYSLGTGDLGYVVAADLAWRLTGDQRYRLTAARILARAWEVGVRGTSVGLHTGRAGLAWTIGRYPHLATKSMEHWCDDFFDAFISADDADRYGSCRHFDLVEGIAGILIAASTRQNEAAAGVARVLLDWCQVSGDRLTIYTPRSRAVLEANVSSGQVENWGVAHGLPGVLGALQICRDAVVSVEFMTILELAQFASRDMFSRFGGEDFPSYLVEGMPTRARHSAWCYGALPVAKLLVNGALHEGVEAYIAPWETQDYWRTKVGGPGRFALCHGSAGVGFILALLAMNSDSKALWNNAMQALGSSILVEDNQRAIFPSTEGLLTGRIGAVAACLSLSSGCTGPVSELLGMERWDEGQS